METTYNANNTLHQNGNQIQEPSENMSNEYRLDPQPKWGSPRKQSASVPTGKFRLDFLKVGFIKNSKRFSGNESSSDLFGMFGWCARNKDKGFFKRLFDYTD